MFMAQYNETIRGGAMDLVFFKVCRLINYSLVLNKRPPPPLINFRKFFPSHRTLFGPPRLSI